MNKIVLGVLMFAVVTSVAAQPPSPSPGQDGRGRGRGDGPRGADPLVLGDHAGFESIFDGTSLKGWEIGRAHV